MLLLALKRKNKEVTEQSSREASNTYLSPRGKWEGEGERVGGGLGEEGEEEEELAEDGEGVTLRYTGTHTDTHSLVLSLSLLCRFMSKFKWPKGLGRLSYITLYVVPLLFKYDTDGQPIL